MVAAWLWSAANWRRAWRFLIALAALAGIVGGVAIATVAGARRATTAVDRMAERTGWPDVFVFTPSEVPAAIRDALATDPRVQEATDVKVVIGGPPGFGPGEGSLIAVPAGSRFAPVVIEGRLPAAGRADEIAVTESALRTGMRVGDRVPLTGVGTGSAVACLGGGAARAPSRRWVTSRSPASSEGSPRPAPTTPTAVSASTPTPRSAEAHPRGSRSPTSSWCTRTTGRCPRSDRGVSPLLTDGDVTDGVALSGAVQATSVRARRAARRRPAPRPSPVPPSSAPGYSRRLGPLAIRSCRAVRAQGREPPGVGGRAGDAAGRRRRPAVAAHRGRAGRGRISAAAPRPQARRAEPGRTSGSTCP